MSCEYPIDDGVCGDKPSRYFSITIEEEDWTDYKCLCGCCQNQLKEEGYDLKRVTKKFVDVLQVMES